MSLLPVAEALAKILAAIPGPVAVEEIPIAQGAGRTLAAETRPKPCSCGLDLTVGPNPCVR